MNVTNLRAGQVFHSRAKDVIGGLIAWAVIWGKPNKNTPNHSGFIVEWNGQYMIAEVDGNGFRLNSLEKYNGKKAQFVAVYDLLIDDARRQLLLDSIARKIRKDFDKPYDFRGAIGSAPWFQRWVPWMKQNPKREFCSEVVAIELHSIGLPVPSLAPNPLELAQYQETHGDTYQRVQV